MSKENRLLEQLAAQGVISRDTQQLVARYCATWAVSGHQGLLETHCFTDDDLASVLAKVYQLKRAKALLEPTAGWQVDLHWPFKQARAWECLVRQQGVRHELIIADPSQSERLAALSRRYPAGLEVWVGSRSDILEAIAEFYPVDLQLAAFSQES